MSEWFPELLPGPWSCRDGLWSRDRHGLCAVPSVRGWVARTGQGDGERGGCAQTGTCDVIRPRRQRMAQLGSAQLGSPCSCPGRSQRCWASALGGKPQRREEALKPGWSEAVAREGRLLPRLARSRPSVPQAGLCWEQLVALVGIYLQEHPASAECGRHPLIPLAISLACAFSSGLSHFKAFLRALVGVSAARGFGLQSLCHRAGTCGRAGVAGFEPILGAVLAPLPPHRGAGQLCRGALGREGTPQ